jgi:two-component system chemotaxis response regulator CheB
LIAIKAGAQIAPDTREMANELGARPDADDVVRAPPKRTLVVIGASGGEGLGQIGALLRALPSDLDAAVLAVLHRPVDQPSRLRDVLARVARLPVRIAVQGQPLRPGVCYIGEPDQHLSVGCGLAVVLQRDAGLAARTIDLLFESAAAAAGAGVAGVILAGSLSDGARGLAAIRDAGGAALVLDPRRTPFSGMPQAALEAAPEADVFAAPEDAARRLVELVGRSGRSSRQLGSSGVPVETPELYAPRLRLLQRRL